MIPKRPKRKAAYYRSREYKKLLRAKFFKWSHAKVVKVWFSVFDIHELDEGRTKVMQKRAQAMFDSMYSMLELRLDQVPQHIVEQHTGK